jgi:hypothetical protein
MVAATTVLLLLPLLLLLLLPLLLLLLEFPALTNTIFVNTLTGKTITLETDIVNLLPLP